MPARHRGARAETSLRWASHRSTSPSSSSRPASAALGVDHRQGGIDDAGVGLVQHDQDVGVGEVEGPGRLGGVVEAEDGRGGPATEDAPAGVEAGRERGEPEGPPTLAGRERVDPEPSLGDDAEGALAADEQLGQVGAGGRTRGVAAGPHHPAVGQHHLEPDDHVLDLPVPVGVLARAAAGQPAPDGREVHRLGPVPQGELVVPPQAGLDVGPEGTGPQVGHQRGRIDVPDAGQPAHVEGDPSVERDRGAAHAAAAPGCRHREPARRGTGPAPRPPGRCRWAGR